MPSQPPIQNDLQPTISYQVMLDGLLTGHEDVSLIVEISEASAQIDDIRRLALEVAAPDCEFGIVGSAGSIPTYSVS